MEHLTPEIIIQEPPGLRLNSWVNENVMIVPPLFLYTDIGEKAIDYYPRGHEERIAPSDRVMAEKVPEYSTDIAEAWKIVETINSRGLPFCIRLNEKGHVIAESGTQCNSGTFYHDETYFTSVPEAICKAALLSMLKNRQ